jgi:hypothetical protein
MCWLTKPMASGAPFWAPPRGFALALARLRDFAELARPRGLALAVGRALRLLPAVARAVPVPGAARRLGAARARATRFVVRLGRVRRAAMMKTSLFVEKRPGATERSRPPSAGYTLQDA